MFTLKKECQKIYNDIMHPVTIRLEITTDWNEFIQNSESKNNEIVAVVVLSKKR